MAYARWRLASTGTEVRVGLYASEPLTEPDVVALWDEVRSSLRREVTSVVFSGTSTWIAIHRHRGDVAGRWHVRSAVG